MKKRLLDDNRVTVAGANTYLVNKGATPLFYHNKYYLSIIGDFFGVLPNFEVKKHKSEERDAKRQGPRDKNLTRGEIGSKI